MLRTAWVAQSRAAPCRTSQPVHLCHQGGHHAGRSAADSGGLAARAAACGRKGVQLVNEDELGGMGGGGGGGMSALASRHAQQLCS